MCLIFTPNPSCKAVYLSRTIFISFWYFYMRVIISIKSFTIGNFVEITINHLSAHSLMALGFISSKRLGRAAWGGERRTCRIGRGRSFLGSIRLCCRRKWWWWRRRTRRVARFDETKRHKAMSA